MSQTSPVAGSRPRIYVVDDEWIIAESLATILAKEGYRAQAFHNPGQAMVRALDQPPDVLIADVMMPGMPGTELAMALRSAGQQCRILLFSGQASAVDLLGDARQRGFDFELLEKPVHPLQLLMRLHHMTPQGQRAAGAERELLPMQVSADPVPTA